MTPFTPKPTEDVKLLLLLLAGFALPTMLIAGSSRGGPPLRRPALFLAPLGLFTVLSVAATVASPYTGLSAVETARRCALFAVWLAAAQAVRHPDEARGIGAAICVAVAVSSLYAFAQGLGWDPFPWNAADLDTTQYRQLPGTFGNPNVAGHALVPALLLGVWLTAQPGRRWCALPSLIILTHIVLTRHRASLLALACALGVVLIALGWMRLRTPSRRAAFTLATLGLLACTGVASVAGFTAIRHGSDAPLDGSLLLRYNSFYGAARMAMDRPLLGFGPGAYEIANVPYWTQFEQEHYARDRLLNHHPHCELLAIASETGLPAALAYLALLITAICGGVVFAAFRPPGSERRFGLLTAAFGAAFLVDGAFGFNYASHASAVFLMLMLGAFAGVWTAAVRPAAPPVARRRAMALLLPLLLLGVAALSLGLLTFYGRVNLKRGQDALYWSAPDEAEPALTRAARALPWSWDAPHALAQVRQSQGDAEGAADCYRQALDRHPYHLPSLAALARTEFNRGSALAAAGDAAGAEQAFAAAEAAAETALDLCPTLPEGHDIVGRLLFRRAAPPEGTPDPHLLITAESHLAEALAAGAPNPSELLRIIAQSRLQRGAPEEAERALLRAAGYEQVDPGVWPTFVETVRRTGDVRTLRDALDRRIERRIPDVRDTARRRALSEALADALEWRARTAELLGDVPPRDAVATFTDAVRLTPGDAARWARFHAYCVQADRMDAFTAALIEASAPNAPERRALPVEVRAAAQALASPADGDHTKTLGESALAVAWLGRPASTDGGGRDPAEIAWAAELIADAIVTVDAPTPALDTACLALAETLLSAARPETALRLLEQTAPGADTPEAQVAARLRAQACMQLGRPDQAEPPLREALRAADAPDLRLALARALAAQGKNAAARLEYMTLLDMPRLPGAIRATVERELRESTAP